MPKVLPVVYMKYSGEMKLLFKIVGSCMVILSSFLIGNSKAAEYKERIKYLESFLLCITKLENEISFTKTPITKAFKNISSGAHPAIEKIFKEAFCEMENFTGELLSDIWKKTVLENSERMFNEDKELIISFSSCFTESDADGQIKNIELYKSKISQAVDNAKEVCGSNMKLYKSLGLYCGILISVLFL